MADAHTTKLPASYAEEMRGASKATGVPVARIIAEGWEAIKHRYMAMMAAKAQTINIDRIYKDKSKESSDA